MQNFDKSSGCSPVEMRCRCLPSGEEEPEPLVVFELTVPRAAKVPALRQRAEVAKLLIRPASVTSTVSAGVLVQLQATNTAQGTAWCRTATLAAPRSAGPASGR